MFPLIKSVQRRVLLAVGLCCSCLVAADVRAQEAQAAASVSLDARLIEAAPENALPELKEVLATAMANAPRVVDSGLSLDSAGVNVRYARAPMLPTVNANIGGGAILETYDYGASQGSAAYVRKRNVQAIFYNAGVSQPVYRWGALKKGYQSAQLQRTIATRNVEEARRALAIDVRRAYFNLINASNSRDLEKTTLAKLEKDLESFKLQQSDGFVTASVVSVAALAVENYKAQMERSTTSFEAQWRAFRRLAGLEETAIWTLPKEVPPLAADLGSLIESLPDTLGASVPNTVLNADDQVRAERLNYEVQKVRQLPQVSMSASVSQENRSPDNTTLGPKQLVTSYGAYLNVSWNLFDGFYTQALKQSSLIQARRYRIARDQADYDARENLRTYVSTLRMDWASLQKAEEVLASYRSLLETYRTDYESGFVQKDVWDAGKVAADSAVISTNNVRANFHILLLNYLSLRGQDPALILRPAGGK